MFRFFKTKGFSGSVFSFHFKNLNNCSVRVLVSPKIQTGIQWKFEFFRKAGFKLGSAFKFRFFSKLGLLVVHVIKKYEFRVLV